MGEKKWFIIRWRNFGWDLQGPFKSLEEAKEAQHKDYGPIYEEIG